MSEDNAQNHANFVDAFSMTDRAIKIDKRLPCSLRKVSIDLTAVQTSDKADRITLDR
jgi:hypothetical protein